MAIKESTFTTFTMPLEIPFLGHTLTVHFRPSGLQGQEGEALLEEMKKRGRVAYDLRAKAQARRARKKAEETGEDPDFLQYQVQQQVPTYNQQDLIYGLPRLITKWDYLDDEDNELPITEEVVGRMASQLRALIWEKMLEVISPKALMEMTPLTGSAPKAK